MEEVIPFFRNKIGKLQDEYLVGSMVPRYPWIIDDPLWITIIQSSTILKNNLPFYTRVESTKINTNDFIITN